MNPSRAKLNCRRIERDRVERLPGIRVVGLEQSSDGDSGRGMGRMTAAAYRWKLRTSRTRRAGTPS